MSAILDIKGLNKSFGGIHAVKDLTMQVNEGEILGLIGPNGSGKSTTVNLISGTYSADSGQILLAGKDITRISAPDRALMGVGRTFQASRPFLDMSVLENIMIGALLHDSSMAKARKSAEEVAEFTGLTRVRDSRSGSLPVETRRRLDLARALALKPKVLMLDESMAGLNPSEMEAGVELVKKIHATGITVVFIEHVMKAVVSLCTRVVVLNQGELLAEGAPRDVLRNEKVVAAYLGGEGHKYA
ncbi:MAG TPA: ABC transporter ATP-binding protein [Symbiobacteriaceae bacterium]